MNILNTFLFFSLLLILNKNCRLKIEKIFSHKIFMKINKLFSLFIILNIFFLILFSTFYLFSNFYLDHVEPQIATVSWFFEYKKIIYNDTSDYERYALIFGPITYYSNYLMMKLFGPSILSSKIISYIERARQYKSDVIVFPELTVTGYPPEDLLHKPYFVDQILASA